MRSIVVKTRKAARTNCSLARDNMIQAVSNEGIESGSTGVLEYWSTGVLDWWIRGLMN
jgi:hypothetical protein